jgi:hypothetical protein
MGAFRIRPVPRLLAYPLLGVAAAWLLWIGIGTVAGWYSIAFFPIPLFAAALGIAAAREWKRPAQRAFVGGCIGVMLASVALIPFETNLPIVLPFMGVGLLAGIGLGLGIKR